MKKIFFILTLFMIFFTFSCEKDEIPSNENDTKTTTETTLRTKPESTLRDGFVDLVFYRNSFTTDNFLLYNTFQSTYRIHKIYNKDKIQTIKFTTSGKSDVSISGILMGHYNLEILYKDGSKENLSAFSKKHLSSFTITPTADNLLSLTNKSKFVSYETLGSSSSNVTSPFYNALRDETYPLFKWVIRRENVIVSIKELQPINKISKQFTVNHIN